MYRRLILFLSAVFIVAVLVITGLEYHFFSTLFQFSSKPLVINIDNGNRISAGPVFYKFDQKSTGLSDQEMFSGGWQRHPDKTMYFDREKEGVWLRFALKNEAPNHEKIYLELDWPFLKNVKLYKVFATGNNRKTNGKRLELTSSFIYRHHLYEIDLLPKQQVTVFLRAETAAKLIVPLILSSKSIFEKKIHMLILWYGCFFSVAVIMLLYNMFLFGFTRDQSYFYYCLYVISIVFYTLAFSGLGTQYFWGNTNWIFQHSYGVMSSFSFLTATIFMRSVLNLKKIGGWLLHLNSFFLISWAVVLMGYAVAAPYFLVVLEDILAIISCPGAIISTGYLWWKGNVTAKYLTIAWIVLVVSTFLLMLGLTDVVSYSSAALNVQMLGIVIEVVLLSIILAERMNRERLEKEKARKQSLLMSLQAREAQEREMEAQRKIIELTEKAKDELEQRVKDRTLELGRAMIDLELANQKLEKISITDPLTGVANRRYYEMIFDSELQRARRSRQSLSMLIVDIDLFKQVNDLFGHQAGDLCLKKVAETIRVQVTRASDFVARYGGEEFIVLLPETNLEQAINLAEKIRMSCQSMEVSWQDSIIEMTVSIGVASLNDGDTYEKNALFESADKALYTAKKEGRNRVVSADILI